MGGILYDWAIEENFSCYREIDSANRKGNFLRIVVDGWEKVGTIRWYVYCVSTIYADRAHQVGGSDKAAI